MKPWRQATQREIFEISMALEARQLPALAERLPFRSDRTEVLRRASVAETASHINEWVTSAGLRAPN